MSAENYILWAIAVPLIGSIGILLAGKAPNIRETITLITAVVMFTMVGALIHTVVGGGRPSVTLLEIFPGLDITFTVEPLGMLFGLVASGLWIVNSIYSIGYMRGNNEKNQTRFYFFFAIALASAVGVAFAGNMLTLFICYEVLTLCTFPLVTHSGKPEAMKSGRTYLGILLSTSIGLQLLAIIWTWHATGTLDFKAGGILDGKVSGIAVSILLFLYMYGIGKAALMPIHRWLPAAMVAPTPVSALLHAVAVVKAGVFTVVKVIVYIFGYEFLANSLTTNWLVYVAGFTILAASIVALRQDNLKRRLAYSTISQLSYVIMAAAILAPLSVMGAVLHIAAHAVGKITLFFAAGSIYTAAHKTEVSQLNGIGRKMPWTMGAFAIASFSMIGVPPTAGFLSKWYILMGALEVEHYFAIGVIIISTLLNAGYFMPIIYNAFFKEADDKNYPHADHGEAPLPVVIALTATAIGTVLLFFFSGLPLELAHQVVGK
ncbi:MAG: monovalent cation/H+ antiporter subunit D family protein [Rhodospirillaceae bacterium]|jgi:multicomponent Na+:H+ antiporter subunit D|nr:monovalent cation/H+ antiporter subunit D family protein [Rhodospirillaceae bacterium]MBT5941975.1 monovalent cation/H+ antiporter subunit D family protein [Rhodospirillaceae bacterium]MBT7957229.1 monovalent cation/H+ antiporter subunit D family protein [Rhodospirillaceae bacterium]